ncbi:acyl-CoA synthetase [Paramagnetospirillum marisnigri]|uniref:Acyl-CoA synthetase n=1 Tax=Paramagnetospirillum marisnigri TaxID=1285242 RepID=A0A178MD72_9PROT|nr:CoA-binding protein [Paramagnetospirillum marisnigri]OAN46760.1 acyl-CoA synthetase [Paramagnetospirillum marisnigri]
MGSATSPAADGWAILCAAAAEGKAPDAARLRAALGLGGTAGAGAVELRFALANTREFGVVISAGVGGVEAELARGNFRRDRAEVHASVALADAGGFLAQFSRTFAYQSLAAKARRAGHAAPDAALLACFERLIALGRLVAERELAPGVTLERLTLDLAAAESLGGGEVACSYRAPTPRRLARPIAKIDKLIHPSRIGIVGVSASGMNFGRIILKNLMGSGYAKEKLLVIRPEETEIDGVRCVPSLKDLDGKLDLLIVAVPSGAVYDLVDEIIATDAVESVMLIPGGLGETKTSVEPAAALAARINAAHGNPGGGPVFLGANCLGVVSHAGGYDSWFIPLERLPKPKKKPQRNSVMLSQSGAFMITRLSRNPWLDPAYMLALGNQTDLTHGDMLSYFAERPEIETIGVYVEGFKDGDGLDFARAVRRAVTLGKQVVVYKSGKTPAGQAGVMGHTASIAGELDLFESVVRQAGAMVAEDLDAFDDLFYMAGALHHKAITGNRLGGISGAGFEAVGMADSTVTETFALEMGELTEATVAKVKDILVAKKLDALVEVRNSIDINPGADDECHLQIVEAFAQDPHIDAVVVGMDPTAPSVMALEESKLRPGIDINNPKSSVHLMPPLVERTPKPIIGVIDGGPLYDAMAARLMDQGVCIFRNCARAVRALARYTEARLAAEAIRTRT